MSILFCQKFITKDKVERIRTAFFESRCDEHSTGERPFSLHGSVQVLHYFGTSLRMMDSSVPSFCLLDLRTDLNREPHRIEDTLCCISEGVGEGGDSVMWTK